MSAPVAFSGFRMTRASLVAAILDDIQKSSEPITIDDLLKKLHWRKGSYMSLYLSIIRKLKRAQIIDAGNGDTLVLTDVGRDILEALDYSASMLAAIESNTVFARPVFGTASQQPPQRSIFVIIPFSKDFDGVFSVISGACLTYGVAAERADRSLAGHVLEDIWQAILHAEMVIADCSGNNPNVLYELGIAHTLGKKTLLIARDVTSLPFDLRTFRFIEYAESEKGLVGLSVALQQALAEMGTQASSRLTEVCTHDLNN